MILCCLATQSCNAVFYCARGPNSAADSQADLAAKRAELRLSEVAERQQALLEDKLVRVIPLVEEANLMSAELKRNTLFEVKVVSKLHQTTTAAAPGLGPAEALLADSAQMQAAVQIKVSYIKEDRDMMWDPDKFQVLNALSSTRME